METSFYKVLDFENELAKYFGSRYCVAVDSCTHAVELCLRQQQIKSTTCPKHTYLSIPMSLKQIGLEWHFVEDSWKDYYQFGNTGIYDAATFWSKGKYIPKSMMCLSFQFKKTLSLGRGGAVLLDDYQASVDIRRMSYDYRRMDMSWKEQVPLITHMGYHYYMTPETAQLGLDKLPTVKQTVQWSWKDYPDLSKAPLFNE